MLTSDEREHFDLLLEQILDTLPNDLLEKLEETPVIVEDYPSNELMDELQMADPLELCGLHSGTALTEQSIELPTDLPNTIHLFRAGIYATAIDEEDFVDEYELQKQIRITLLHELGHHFGLSEEDLKELGYD